jgi:hypothetical protein
MNRIVLKPGDVLLYPKESTPGVYTFLAEIGKKELANLLSLLTNHEYIHAELYLGNGWVLAGTFEGVKLYKPDLRTLLSAHIYRPPTPVNSEELRKVVTKYFNLEYDWASLLLNAIPEILSFGNEQLERMLENWLNYKNENKMICSEVIARIFKDLGYEFEPNGDFVTPDDIAEKFVKIFPAE